MEKIERSRQRRDISRDIPKAAERTSLEAMGWDGIPDVLNGEVWDLKRVSVGVD